MKEDYDLKLDEMTQEIVPRTKKGQRSDSSSAWYYLGFIGEVGFTIAIPIAGGALIGTFADRSWGTYPKATLSFLFAGIVVSLVGFVRLIQDIVRQR